MTERVDAATLRTAAREAADGLRSSVEAGELPGIAFGVATADHGTVAVEVAGVADPTNGRRVSTDTPFCLASTTKPIATTVLGALLEQGVIALDDLVRDLVPEMPAALVAGAEPTIRHIADHTAGLGPHHRFFYADEREPVSVESAVANLGRPGVATGQRWSYSNLGYGVLQLALERASRTPMNLLAQRHVFDPLVMTSSGWGGLVGPDHAAVRCGNDGHPLPPYVTDHPPASEGWSSIDDLLTFGLAHAGESLLDAETHQLLATPSAPTQPDAGTYALGWVVRDFGETRLLIHAGQMGGVAAHLVVSPTHGLVVAALANTETGRLGEAVGTVLSAVVPGWHPPITPDGDAAQFSDLSAARRWTGVVAIGDDTVDVVLDARGADVEFVLGDQRNRVVMARFAADHVTGHVNMSVDHPLVPAASMIHLDLVPDSGSAPESVLSGHVVFACYPTEERPRQGDAVSFAARLTRDA